MAKKKSPLSILGYVLLVILAFLAGVCLSVFIQTIVSPDKVPSIFGFKPFIVLSDSMEAEISKGDLAITKAIDTKNLKTNDIIAFRDDDDHVVTHRIIEINEDGKFVTKGDANSSRDQDLVEPEDVEGLYLYKMAGLGNVVLAVQKPITLIIILVIIVAGGVIWILLDKNKLSESEREELEKLRKEKMKGDKDKDTK